MLKINQLRSVAFFSFALIISGCQVGGLSSSSSKYDSLEELQKIEFPSTEAPEGIADGAFETKYADGKPELKTWIHKGCLDKYLKSYYKNGKMESDISLKNCQVDGLVRTYHDDGRIDIEMTASNGKLSGPFKIYHNTPSNKPHIIGTFNNGELVDEITEFDENGSVTTKGYFRNGKVYLDQ
ncbi:toxin-antitoxin system YwqK family antitoxin [Providencia vermicola]|uniref:toxin-antitoxin system YwqK family antitoxin n=1 Tax=Providencia vermicola TaxID=333965 RepID=UPI0021FA8DC7|nr:hypothetical protein NFC79_07770 [Providencia stuartii]